MINNSDKHDKFIKELVQKTGMEQPSKDFTARVMQRLEPQPEGSYSLFSPMVMVSSAIALVTLILVVVFMDIPFVEKVFSFTYLSEINFTNIFTYDLLNSFINLFSGINISTISLVTGFSIVSLLVIDRVLKMTSVRSDINLYL